MLLEVTGVSLFHCDRWQVSQIPREPGGYMLVFSWPLTAITGERICADPIHECQFSGHLRTSTLLSRPVMMGRHSFNAERLLCVTAKDIRLLPSNHTTYRVGVEQSGRQTPLKY